MSWIDKLSALRNAITTPQRAQTQGTVFNNGRSSSFGAVNNQNSPSLQSLYVGLNMDGSIRVGLNTYFSLIKKNYVIGQSLRFLSERVGGNGFYFADKSGKRVQGPIELTEKVKRFFSTPSLKSYIYKSIAYYTTSGQKICTSTELNTFGRATENAKVNILDPRMVRIVSDEVTGEITKYQYHNTHIQKDIDPGLIVDNIMYPDLDRDNYGQSPMDNIVIDAVTDYAMGNRQFHLYRNNATPGTVYLLDPTVVTDQMKAVEFERKIEEKFGGTANSGKPFSSTAVKDVKTIEIPDLSIIEEREYIMKIVSMVFGIDPRVLGFMKETGGSYAEIDAISRNMTNAKLEGWTNVMEYDMNTEYTRFFGEIPYRIRLDTIYFKNINIDKETSLKEVEKGIMSPEEYKSLYNM